MVPDRVESLTILNDSTLDRESVNEGEPRARASSGVSSLTEHIGRRAIMWFATGMPLAARDATTGLLLNDLGCLALGSGPEVDRLVEWARRSTADGQGPATAIGIAPRMPAEVAAFVNACRIHGLVLDSTHYPSQAHLGGPAISAALACAQAVKASGQAFHRSVAIGVETAARIGESLVEPVVERGLRASAVFGPFAAATAASLVLGFDAEQLGAALALACNFAAGTSQTWRDGSDEWLLQVGLAARAGVSATHLVAAGYRGASGALEGASGFIRSLGGSDEHAASLHDAFDSSDWRILGLSYKTESACNIAQVPVMLLTSLGSQAGSRGSPLSVRCYLNPVDAAYPGTSARHPTTWAAALMSVSFCMGAVLVHGRLPIEVLRSPLAHPHVMSAAQTVEVVADPAIPPLGARIEVTYPDGRVAREALTGDERMFSWALPEVEAETNARLLAASWGADATDDATRAVREIDQADTVEDLIVLLGERAPLNE